MPDKLKVYNGGPQEHGAVYLRLIEVAPNEIMLAAVDRDGNCLLDPDSFEYAGALLTITPDGTVALSPAVMPSLGFSLDQAGRVRIDPYGESMAAKHAQRFGGKRASFRQVK